MMEEGNMPVTAYTRKSCAYRLGIVSIGLWRVLKSSKTHGDAMTGMPTMNGFSATVH